MLPTDRPPTHPGEMLLKASLEPLGVSQVEAATRMSIPFQRLNGIVKGRRAVSANTALLLEALTGWDAQIWLTLQAKWDLWHAMKARGARPHRIGRRSHSADEPVAEIVPNTQTNSSLTIARSRDCCPSTARQVMLLPEYAIHPERAEIATDTDRIPDQS